MVLLDVAFENKGTKDIAGAKCVLAITDMFGDKILNLHWSFDDVRPVSPFTAHPQSAEQIRSLKAVPSRGQAVP